MSELAQPQSFLMFHASKHVFDIPVYEQIAVNRENHANGLLGLWVSHKSDWIAGFGEHLYEIEFSGSVYDLTIAELASWCDNEDGFYLTKRKELLDKGFSYMRLIESDGRSEMGVIINFNSIQSCINRAEMNSKRDADSLLNKKSVTIQQKVTNEQIAAAIRQVRDRYIATGEAPSYWAINNGLCDEFAQDVTRELGGETGEIYGVGNGNFSVDGDDFSGQWDWNLLQSHWGINPTLGLTKNQATAIDFGSHVWLTDGNRHYDSECPDGVFNFFDLPIFQRHIVQELRESGVACADVITQDVTPAPPCPVANPAEHELSRPRMTAG